MREMVELLSLDLRYEGHRLRDDAREARLLASIAERGIEEPLEGVDTPDARLLLDESSLASSPMLPYVRMVVSLIEGVEFSCREVVHLLRQAMRQHSIGARRRIDYLLGFLHQHPP